MLKATIWDRKTKLVFIDKQEYTAKQIFALYPELEPEQQILLVAEDGIIFEISKLSTARQTYDVPEQYTTSETLSYIVEIQEKNAVQETATSAEELSAEEVLKILLGEDE